MMSTLKLPEEVVIATKERNEILILDKTDQVVVIIDGPQEVVVSDSQKEPVIVQISGDDMTLKQEYQNVIITEVVKEPVMVQLPQVSKTDVKQDYQQVVVSEPTKEPIIIQTPMEEINIKGIPIYSFDAYPREIADERFVNVDGDIMKGALILRAPSDFDYYEYEAIPKIYVDEVVALRKSDLQGNNSKLIMVDENENKVKFTDIVDGGIY